MADNLIQVLEAFPTHVGLNRISESAEGGDLGVPHARGAEPAAASEAEAAAERSPRTWG